MLIMRPCQCGLRMLFVVVVIVVVGGGSSGFGRHCLYDRGA